MNKNKPVVLACIQARMGSSRLPAKVLREVLGKSLLEHIYNRVSKAQTVDHTVIIT